MSKIVGDSSLVGGKAESLLKLTDQGLPVPPFFVVSDDWFQTHLQKLPEYQGFLSSFKADTSDVVQRASEVREALMRAELSRDLKTKITEELQNLSKGSFFSVRSSALGEDSAGHSFAGQMDSFLFCRDQEDVFRCLKACWASLFSERAIAYRKLSSLTALDFRMGVVIQTMIEGEVSGICFSVNALNSQPNEILIHAAFGLGEGIVSGALDADQFVVDRSKLKILREEVAAKERQVVFDKERGWGTTEKSLDDIQAKKASLSAAQCEALAKYALQIETFYGFPQDIEWTLQNGKIFILQSRPITTLEDAWRFTEVGRQELKAYETIWDNSNIVESYSGVTTPLTYSFAKHCYHIVYVQFCEILGVPKKTILSLDFPFQNMLGLLRGRIYYNLNNWYRLISVLPGYKYNKEFMEQMMGVKESTDFQAQQHITAFQKYFMEFPKLLWAGGRLFYRFIRLDRDVEKFTKIVSEVYEKYKNFDFKRLSLHENVETYFEIENKVLRNWKPPIVNDFMAMIFYGLLQKIMILWKLDETGSLQNKLLSAQGDVESTLPIKELQEIAAEVQSNPALKALVEEYSAEAMKSKILDSEATSLSDSERKLRKRILHYLDLYGFRCMNELKLEEPSLKERPDFVFKILKNYVSSNALLSISNEHEDKEAYLTCLSMLKGRRLFGLLPKTWLFKFILSYAKKAVKVREYQRFARTKMFGLMRNLFNAIGYRFHALKLIEEPKDVFYLTREEIFNYIVGASVTEQISDLIRLRKSEFAAYRLEDEPADRARVRGAVYLHRFKQEEAELPQTEGVLHGTSCCPGIVKGPVKVILKPSDDMSLQGEILVAGRTDPGWVTLYPSASGLLIERGSVLSHSAIVARELGLPAIVGIPNITKILKTGDVVEMDGQTGSVSVLGEEQENELQRAAQ